MQTQKNIITQRTKQWDTTIAQELGHGYFQLKHPFEMGLKQGDLKDNLMDYDQGVAFNKYEWDLMHDPGIVTGLFESDTSGQLLAEDRKIISRILNEIKTCLENGIYTYKPFANISEEAKKQKYFALGGLNYDKDKELDGYISIINLQWKNTDCSCNLKNYKAEKGIVYTIKFGDCIEITTNYESTYNFILGLLKTPLKMGVKAGKIIFVNGYYNEILSTSTGFKTYWGKDFEQQAKLFLNENSDFPLYVDASTIVGGDESGGTRMQRGKLWAKNNKELLLSNTVTNAPIYLFGHSEGAAYAAGIASFLKENGYNVKSIFYLAGDEMDEFDSPASIPEAYQISYASCKRTKWWRHFPYDPIVGDNKNNNVKIYGVVYRDDIEEGLKLHSAPAEDIKIFSELEDLIIISNNNKMVEDRDASGKINYLHPLLPVLKNNTRFFKINYHELIECK